jgi:O-antigen/teichoic acid export membrane protein
VGWGAALWLAGFYHEPSLTSLLRVAFLVMTLNGLTSPGLFVLEKQLKFGRVILVTQGGGLAGTIVSLILALYYPNVWSLVVGFVAEAFFRFIGSFLIYPFWPKFRFDRQAAGELFRFSQGMVGLPILTFLFIQADIFVLGRLCSKELLGYYSLALTLAATPQLLFSCIAGPMILPVFSEMQEQKERLRNNLLRMTKIVYLFGLPMAACLAIFARPILVIVYGGNYGQVYVAFAMLNIYTVFYITGTFIASIYFAVGRPEIHRWFIIVQLFLVVICIYPAVKWVGASGAAATKLLCMVLASIVQLVILKKLLDLPIRRYVQTAKEGFLLALGVSLPALIWRYWIDSLWLQMLGGMVLCGLVWLIAGLNLRNAIKRRIFGLAE